MTRINVETEPDWLRVKVNINSGLMGVMEARISELPGGKDGEAAKAVRGELEMRLAKVSISSGNAAEA